MTPAQLFDVNIASWGCQRGDMRSCTAAPKPPEALPTSILRTFFLECTYVSRKVGRNLQAFSYYGQHDLACPRPSLPYIRRLTSPHARKKRESTQSVSRYRRRSPVIHFMGYRRSEAPVGCATSDGGRLVSPSNRQNHSGTGPTPPSSLPEDRLPILRYELAPTDPQHRSIVATPRLPRPCVTAAGPCARSWGGVVDDEPLWKAPITTSAALSPRGRRRS
jgi:hypothetical protein